MAKVHPTKKSEHIKAPGYATAVVTHSRLAEGMHSAVFPQNADGGHPFGHMSPRMGHPGPGNGKAKLTK
ncbi:hypothetical protein UFOVP2_26 [uncultured Caudovirales phage]|uniref:Uncharacterized protein n=1 Tax=uncultured Caudovirales phage TaxID=2100421 RepID=A0A6J5KFX7_9CAUD|nr:hypothetical protein UFOVP2_26 [uncultured Caudovirales phage]